MFGGQKWISNNEQIEENFKYWVNLPNINPAYLGFFVKFSKGVKIDNENFLLKVGSEFTGLMFPDMPKRYPDIFHAIKETAHKAITDPMCKAISENQDYMLDMILNDNKVILASAVLELTVSDVQGAVFCVQRFAALSVQNEQQINQLGIFN